MVVLDGLPIKRGTYGCGLPTSAGCQLLKEPATINRTERLSHVNQSPCNMASFLSRKMQFVACVDDW